MSIETELQELSKRVAEKYKPDGYFVSGILCGLTRHTKPQRWLHKDWNTLMALAIKHGININRLPIYAEIKELAAAYICKPETDLFEFTESYADHASPEQATAVAILRALEEIYDRQNTARV